MGNPLLFLVSPPACAADQAAAALCPLGWPQGWVSLSHQKVARNTSLAIIPAELTPGLSTSGKALKRA